MITQRVALLVTFTALAVSTVTLAGAVEDYNGATTMSVTNRGVAKRMNSMARADAAIQALGDMMGGRRFFNKAQARAVRKILIETMDETPSLFRRRHSDPMSRASPAIWTQKKDFRNKAKAARQAAQKLDVDRLNDLRRTLPALVVTCFDCHDLYRRNSP